MEEKIEVMQNIYDKNDEISEKTKERLESKGVFTVNVMGAPGAGKTSVIKSVIGKTGVKSYVLEGDIESDIDTKNLKDLGISATQINTHGECHLDAVLVNNAISGMEFPEKGVLFIENIGNLVCPAEFTIGEHIKMLILTTADGSDKPYKYPLAFQKASIIVLNKADLLPYVDFDEEFFMAGVRTLNPEVKVFKVSAKTGAGIDEVALWLKEKMKSTI